MSSASVVVPSKGENFDELRRKLHDIQQEEEILKDNPSRWVILPLKFPNVWEMFKKHERAFWTAEDFLFSEDIKRKELSNFKNVDVLHAIQKLLTFSVLCETKVYGSGCVRACHFLEEIQIPEGRAFYGFQCAFEMIHYELLNQLFIFFCANKKSKQNGQNDKQDKHLQQLLKDMMEEPVVKEKKDWLAAHTRQGSPFSEKLIVMCILKTIFNACNKVMHGWCAKEGVCKTLCMSFEKIAKDFFFHSNFCFQLYQKLAKTRLPYSVLTSYLESAIRVETNFAKTFLPFDKMGFTLEDFVGYLEFTANEILKKINENEFFKRNTISLPFMIDHHSYVDIRTTKGETNENKNVGEGKNENPANPYGQQVFSVDADF